RGRGASIGRDRATQRLGRLTGLLLAGLRQRRAATVVIIVDHTVEALEALGHHDLAIALDRLHRATTLAELARAAAFRLPLEEVQNVEPVEYRQNRAEGAEEPAEGALGEKTDEEQHHRI